MKKISYLILSLALCTAGIGTAAHLAPTYATGATTAATTAINDTIDVNDADDEDEEFFDEEDEEFGDFTEDEDDEFGKMHDETDEAAAATADTTGVDIEMTEGMLIDADMQMQEWNNKQNLSESATPTDSTDIDTARDEYIRRLQRIPAIMEMPYNDVVRKYIDQYTGRLRRSVSIMLGAQNFYMPMFEEALEAEGCPLELKYLPIIESALDPTATSRVGAVGLWQFMISTGKQYGLEVNTLVDERRDPLKSSHAAARYFRKLYNQFGDWTLVIAAYNCGPTNVEKAITRAGGSRDYWQIYPYLPRETRGYVPAFIAANYVMQYYCQHGIEPLQSKLPAESDTIMISRDLHLQQVADLCQVDIQQLKSLNPQYRQDIIPGTWKTSPLRLPAEAVTPFLTLGDSIYNHRAGELLPRRALASVNEAYLPVVHSGNGGTHHSSKTGSHSKSKKKSSSRTRTVTIRQGDTLSSIAKRNGTTVAKLKKLNGISGSNIRAGKKIKVK